EPGGNGPVATGYRLWPIWSTISLRLVAYVIAMRALRSSNGGVLVFIITNVPPSPWYFQTRSLLSFCALTTWSAVATWRTSIWPPLRLAYLASWSGMGRHVALSR